MKSFGDFRRELNQDPQPDQLDESRLVRKGLGLMYSGKSKSFGDKSVRHFQKMKQEVQRSFPDDDPVKRLERLEKGLVELSDGLTNMRYQIGSLVSMVNVVVLLNERTDEQIRKVMKPRRRR